MRPHVALVPAAGSGRRLGAGGPKALVEVAGRSLLHWSVEALASARQVTEVVVAVPPDEVARFDAVRTELGIDAWTRVVAGGETRADSVSALVNATDADRVLVHDAARPCITGAFVDALIDELGDDPAGVPGHPVRDTLKRVQGGVVVETVSREGLVAVETPQLFDRALLARAHAARRPGDPAVTDDAMLVEAVGERVRILTGMADNVKVTFEADLELVRRTLAARGGGR